MNETTADALTWNALEDCGTEMISDIIGGCALVVVIFWGIREVQMAKQILRLKQKIAALKEAHHD